MGRSGVWERNLEWRYKFQSFWHKEDNGTEGVNEMGREISLKEKMVRTERYVRIRQKIQRLLEA